MRLIKFTLASLILSFSVTLALGQDLPGEICNNGVDDDGDGFIDCFDIECTGAVNCDDGFIGEEPICEVPPTAFPTFAIKQQWASANETASANGSISVGDVDNDGIPEVISSNYYTNTVSILNGATGATEKQATFTERPYNEVMIADIDGDGCSEIFFPYYTGSPNYDWGVIALDCNLTELWNRPTLYRPGNIGVTDFDGDGFSELYVRDEIIDAHSGAMMHSSGFSDDSDDSDFIEKLIPYGGVAVDILADGDCTDCTGQELVLGGRIYSVDINRGALSATINLEESIGYKPVYYSSWKQNRTGTSVADYNLDGFLDVMMPGLTTSGSNQSHTRVFFWDVHNGTFDTYRDNSNDWGPGAGRLNIADIDGDGQLNATYVSGPYLYALDENWNQLWRVDVVESSSGTTGTTVFDFNGDGSYETVYRDEDYLYIINGTDGSFYTSVACRSLTFVEYPIVADLDNDGATEICVTCITNNSGDIYDDTDEGQVRVFESDGEDWVAARKLWNQHGYFNVNVNDDLTIPQVMQKHHLVFSTGICDAGDTRPLNSFLNQSPFITAQGCPNYAAPDLNYVDGSLVINPPQCPETDFTVSFDVSNDGDKDINFSIPITFYNGDPLTGTATQLNTIVQNLVIPTGTTITISNVTVVGPGSEFELYVFVNHDGSGTLPLILSPNPGANAPVGGVTECDPTNNIGNGTVVPGLFDVSVAKVSDNEKCLATSLDNGEARAFVLVGGIEETADYTFNWYNNSPPAGPVDFTGASYANIAEGTYSVTAVHSSKLCESDTVSVTIDLVAATAPVVTIDIEKIFSDCKNPNGKLRAIVNGGAPPGGFDFEWYVGNNIFVPADLVSVSAVASTLNPQLYSVVVVDKSTGCQTIASETVPNSADFPVVSATVTNHLTVCGASGNGSATADVGGATGGFTFEWYNGSAVKPTSDHTGSTYTNLPAGQYTVTATKNSTGCTSDPFVVDILNQASQPTVSAQVDTHQTSCDASGNNGSVSANVGGATAGFTFNWYQGQTTAPAFEVAGSPSPNVGGLAAGIYTVKVTDNTSGCFDTDEVTINGTPTDPVVTASADVVQSVCTVGAEDGEVSADVAGVTAGFTFHWFNGDQTAGTPDVNNPDFTGVTYTGLIAGDYTVVAINNSTTCVSDPVLATVVDNTAVSTPTIATALTHQTSCDATNSNGAITASVTAGGVDADFTFRVFAGQNTDPY